MSLTKVSYSMIDGAPVNVLDYGAVGDGIADDTNALKDAIAAAKLVYLPAGTYRITSPLYLTGVEGSGGTQLIGAGSGQTIISKSTVTAGTGSNTSRGGTVTDSYAVDAAIILTHADNSYAYDVAIQGLSIVGATNINAYAIYHPRASGLKLKDVTTFYFKYGNFTYDTWLSTFESVTHWGGGPTPWSAFYWKIDTSGGATGTTCTFIDCWARDGTGTGWNITGLGYSSLINCAADNILGSAYYVETSQVSMMGCGSENIVLTASGFGMYFNNSVVNMIGCRAYAYTGDTGATYWKAATSSVVAQECKFDDYTLANGAYNIGISDTSNVVDINNTWPSNGNTFISYTSNSTRRRIVNGVDTVESSVGSRTLQSYLLTNASYSASITPDASATYASFVITPNNTSAFTINAPTNPKTGGHLEISIVNGVGAMGAITWDSIYKLSAWTNPANGYSRSILFRYNGTNWVQVSQTAVDVPN